MWRCNECLTYYDTKIQDSLLKDITGYQLQPYTELQHYPVYDENDLHLAFVVGVDPHNTTELEGLEIRQHDNQRVQRIHVSGSFAEAIRAGALSSKTRAQQQEGLEE